MWNKIASMFRKPKPWAIVLPQSQRADFIDFLIECDMSIQILKNKIFMHDGSDTHFRVIFYMPLSEDTKSMIELKFDNSKAPDDNREF